MKELQNLRDILCDELKEYGKQGDKLSAGSLSAIDTLAHALKNLDKVIEDDDGYSGHYPYYGGSYDMGGRGAYRDRALMPDGVTAWVAIPANVAIPVPISPTNCVS